MSKGLPSKTYQKRLSYRTTRREVLGLFRLINREVFNDKLPKPKIEIMPRCRTYWGMCTSLPRYYPDYASKKSQCTIRISDKWFCKQWLITTLAHEMCHQYQWDIDGYKRIKEGKEPIMSHGPSFFKWKEKLKKHGIPLKTAHGMKRWFKHQSMFRC